MQVSAECLSLVLRGKEQSIISRGRANSKCSIDDIKGDKESFATKVGESMDLQIFDNLAKGQGSSSKSVCLSQIVELVVDGMYISIQGKQWYMVPGKSLKNSAFIDLFLAEN